MVEVAGGVSPHALYRTVFRSAEGQRVVSELWKYLRTLTPEQQTGAAMLMGHIHVMSDPEQEPRPAKAAPAAPPVPRLPRSA